MTGWFARRYLDVLGSIYIYNEHRGYTALDRVLERVRARNADDPEMIAAVERHRRDERKHYVMFRRWFERRGAMPLSVDRAFGHIDRFVEIMFGRSIDRLDTQSLIDSDRLFERLCRVIVLTEQRGYRQVEILLANRFVQDDPILMRIFGIIQKDEPSHWAPYEGWLRQNGKRDPRWWERAVDGLVHSELLFIKLPFLFLNPWIGRRSRWADAEEAVAATPPPLAPVAA
jgi:hypothetical protein